MLQTYYTVHIDQEIDGGVLYIYLKYANIMPLLNLQYSLCDFLSVAGGGSCPVNGSVTITYKTTIPKGIPTVRVTCNIIFVHQHYTNAYMNGNIIALHYFHVNSQSIISVNTWICICCLYFTLGSVPRKNCCQGLWWKWINMPLS